LHFANQAFALRACTDSISLGFDDRRRRALHANAKFAAEVNDLGVCHSEFFGDLVNAFGFWQSF